MRTISKSQKVTECFTTCANRTLFALCTSKLKHVFVVAFGQRPMTVPCNAPSPQVFLKGDPVIFEYSEVFATFVTLKQARTL
jgi:hypothetical protein